MKRYLLPVGILVIGVMLRWYGLDWSLKYIHTFHPDEMRLIYAVGDISWQPVYRFSQSSLESLRQNGVPGEMVQQLTPLREQAISGKRAFLAAVDEQIGHDQRTPYETPILRAALWKNLNPKFFAYGSLPIYLLKAVTDITHTVTRNNQNPMLIGRKLSALWGSLTLLCLYLLGKRFFSERVALLSAAFLALTVLHIQLSHFLTVDVMLTALVVLAIYFLAGIVESATPLRNYAFAGIAIGLSLATKVSAAPLYGVLLAAHLLLLLKLRDIPTERWPRAWQRHPRLVCWGFLLLAIVLSGAVYMLCSPYSVLDFREFYRQVKEQDHMVRGLSQPPYVIQYEHTTPYWYPIRQLLLHSMGLPLGLLTLIGTLFLTLDTGLKIPRLWHGHADFPRVNAVVLLWTIPIFLITGGFSVKFLRYMLPLIPFFCLAGAILIDRLLDALPERKPLIVGILIVTLGFSALYATAFVTIYRRDDPRVQASRWIQEHLPNGAVVLTESWEFAPYVGLPGATKQIQVIELESYAQDDERRVRVLAERLSQGDAVLLATKRIYGSTLRVPERFPRTAVYYQQLFDGALGFTPAAVLTNYPSLFGLTFNDDFADESFSVYEHPKTIVFRKTAHFSAEELYQRIMTAAPVEKPQTLMRRFIAFPAFETEQTIADLDSRVPRGSMALMLKAQGVWDFIQPVLWWVLIVEILGLIAWPFVMLIFRRLPDGGYGIAKTIGLLLPAYLVWLLTSLNFLTFTPRAVAGITGVVAILAAILLIQFWPFFLEMARRVWKTFLAEEAIFLAVFLFFLSFRAYNPDIFWSESSMDFSFLNVLTRSEHLPPPDPWIAGEPLNYYYFGHYLVATLTKLTGIAPQVTYNLAFALFPALTAMAVGSVIYNLIRRFWWSVVGVGFATFLGNLDGFFLLVAVWRTRVPLLDRLLARIPALNTLIGREHGYRFFRVAHEVIPYTVHEFPFWTSIFVDLHAHLMNMPFLIATFLAGLNLLADEPVLPFAALRNVSASRLVERLTFGLYALLVGTLGVISSWDYPTGVIFLLFVAGLRIYKNTRFVRMMPLTERLSPLWLMLGVIPGSLLCYAPFYASFSRSGMGIGWSKSFTTSAGDFLTMFGFFLLLIVAWLAAQAYRSGKAVQLWSLVGVFLTVWVSYALVLSVGELSPFFRLKETFLQRSPVNMAGPTVESLKRLQNREFATKREFLEEAARTIGSEATQQHLPALLKNAATSYHTILLLVFLMALSSYLLFSQPESFRHLHAPVPEQWYVWLCLIYACLIASGCDIVFVRDFLQGGEYKRMNTIFKFYIPVWYFFAIVATYALFSLLKHWKRAFSPVRWIWGGIAVLMFLMAAAFPLTVTGSRRYYDLYGRQQLPPTLDGLAFLQAANPDEYRAIAWLNTHVAGTPVILEASKWDYLYEYARISANTGLLAVLGWPSHAEQREHWGQAHPRELDIKEMYASANIERVRELLKKYDVTYVYVGRTERRDFSVENLQKFDAYPAYFERVFQSGDTAIYQVR